MGSKNKTQNFPAVDASIK